MITILSGFISSRSRAAERLIEGEPRLLVRHGRVIPGALEREQITHPELMSALRSEGCAGPGEVAAAILETDGRISVIRRERRTEPSGENS